MPAREDGEARAKESGPVITLDPARSFESPFHSQGVFLPGTGGLAIVSGQVGVRPDATTGKDVTEQTRIAFENIARVLAGAELGLADVASLRIYLTSIDHIETFTQAAGPCLGGHRPAATLLIVEQLANPALLVQIEAIAAGRH